MTRPLILILLLGVAACGTPQEQCIRRSTGDLRVVDRLIAETEGNLARGYALEEVTEYRSGFVPCRERLEDGTIRTRYCFDDREYTVTRPKAVDLYDEARKLDSLKDRRRGLVRAANAAVAQCQATYPEAA